MSRFPTAYADTRELPPYTGILVVDAKGFTNEPGSTHQALSGLIPKLARQAFRRARLTEAWNAQTFFNSTGDGFALGVPTRWLPALVHPLLLALQQELRAYDRDARRGDPRLRLRASLHVGPVALDGDQPELGGNGTARNEAHRLLDSTEVRRALEGSSPAITHLVAILSDRVFQDVVAGGYTGRHPDQFTQVLATVPGKGFMQRAWLHVPEPSAAAVPEAAAGAGEHGPAGAVPGRPPGRPAAARPEAGDLHIEHNSGQVAGIVHGGMRQTRRDR